ncbi:microtubule-associated serine/threonine-protein kinase 4-like [Eublepharis macularius]|uniref:Microtubule-associated serine/threonine-protein kinase 4-like n=1 Tax=Eublepharis macularius TaxID=481883 RepID=A0AA97L548_EUBMA|nr:microtubule-associated serine/threonine-protein kinase 4-like [Eublepharis macularius]
MGEKVSSAEEADCDGRRGSSSSSSSGSSSSGSQTLSEEGDVAAAGATSAPSTGGQLGGGFPRDSPLSRSTPERQGVVVVVVDKEPPPLTVATGFVLRGKKEGDADDSRDTAGQRRGSEEEEEEEEDCAGGGCGHFRPESDASLEEQDEELDSILSPPSMPFRKSSNPEVSSGPGKSLKFKRQLSEDGRPFRRGSLGGALTGRYLLPNAVTQPSWQTGETSNLVRMHSQALGQSAPSLTASLDLLPVLQLSVSHGNAALYLGVTYAGLSVGLLLAEGMQAGSYAHLQPPDQVPDPAGKIFLILQLIDQDPVQYVDQKDDLSQAGLVRA